MVEILEFGNGMELHDGPLMEHHGSDGQTGTLGTGISFPHHV